jgi:hypothetical protein
MRYTVIAGTICVLLLPLAPLGISQVKNSCPSTALDHNPKLLSSLEPLRQAVRAEGYSGRLLFRLTVTESGDVRDAVVTYPTDLVGVKSVTESIQHLNFCPAVRYGRYTSQELRFDILIH